MSPRLRALALLALFAGAPVRAQTPSTPAAAHPERTRLVRVAKWTLLGAAVGFAAYALAHSTRAEDAYAALKRLCDDEPEQCRTDGGRYPDVRAERLYQRSRGDDRRAQVGIIGGQVALVGSAALFIYDLRNGRGPVNIPYPSSSRALALPRRPLGLGVRLSF